MAARVMKEFGRLILAAVDLGDDWSNIVAHAIDIAKTGGTAVQLLHIVEELPKIFRLGLSTRRLRDLDRQREEGARSRMKEASAMVEAAGLKAMVSVVTGVPAREILATAEEMGAGLIVCGAGETEGVEWLIVGTTADRVIRQSKVPVLVVGPRAPVRFRRVLAPTDLDRPDQGAIRLAAKLARDHEGRVTVLHVYAEPSLRSFRMGDLATLRKECKARARETFERYVAGLALPDGALTPHKLLVATEDKVSAAEAILAEAVRLRMDLIVMALGSISLLRSVVIGSTAEKIIRRLPCSLLALPADWGKKR